jgi:hypothetical protein
VFNDASSRYHLVPPPVTPKAATPSHSYIGAGAPYRLRVQGINATPA